MFEFLKNHKGNLFIATILLYGYGVMYNTLFYSNYGINYIYYGSLSESLLFSVKMLINLILFIGSMEFIMMVSLNAIRHFISLIPINKIQNYVESDLKSKYFNISSLIYFVTSLIFLFVIRNEILLLLFLIIIITRISLFKKPKDQLENKKYNNLAFNLILVLIVICTIKSMDISIDNIRDIHYQQEISMKLNLNDTTYNAGGNQPIRYLGEASNFIFLYDLIKKESLIINKNDLKFISIKPLERENNIWNSLKNFTID